MRSLIVIPARAGSKGVPGKNKKSIAGKPLIRHTIDYALEEVRDNPNIQVCVSSDSEEILSLCTDNVYKIFRPPSLASDSSDVVDAVIHSLNTLSNDYKLSFEYVILLQPTAPIRKSCDIARINDLLMSAPGSSVISVVAVSDEHPARMYSIGPQGDVESLFGNESEVARRQDLPVIYRRNGCFYGCTTKQLRDEKTFFGPNKKLYIMDPNDFCNIDEPRDWVYAAAILEAWSENSNY
jgi:CMP-N,N'-diacetyllegionaminic acid synthase